jgi:hypothetical protein
MNTRRILLVTAPRTATLAPIYAALLLLVALSLLGLVVAAWPTDPVPVGSAAAHVEAAANRHTVEEDLRQSPRNHGSRVRAIWL